MVLVFFFVLFYFILLEMETTLQMPNALHTVYLSGAEIGDPVF